MIIRRSDIVHGYGRGTSTYYYLSWDDKHIAQPTNAYKLPRRLREQFMIPDEMLDEVLAKVDLMDCWTPLEIPTPWGPFEKK